MSEHDEQVAVVEWLFLQRPRLLFWATPNGAHLAGSAGQRARKMNALKAEGLLPGVADLFIAEPRGGWHGCFVEMKRRDGGTLQESQKEFLAEAERRGYYTIVAHGADEAIELIQDYLVQ